MTPAPSTRLYVSVWTGLVALTAVTVGVSLLDMKNLAVFTALLVATVKAALVTAYFMHLRFERPLYAVLFAVGLGSFAIFIGLTFADLEYRFF